MNKNEIFRPVGGKSLVRGGLRYACTLHKVRDSPPEGTFASGRVESDILFHESRAPLPQAKTAFHLRDCLKRWCASVTRHAGCPATPDSAPGVPASAGVWPEPADAGTPAPGPSPHDPIPFK